MARKTTKRVRSAPRSVPERMISGQLALYEKQADAWKSKHLPAMECHGLESLIGFGLSIYRSLQRFEEALTHAVQTKKSEFREIDARRLTRLYSEWLKPGEVMLDAIGRLESEGFAVEEADAFREACGYLRSLLSIPLNRVRSAPDPSQFRTSAEVRDALRRQVLR